MGKKSATRISLDAKLYPVLQRIRSGVVLDVGAKSSPYKSMVRHIEWMTLDANPETGADIVADVHRIPWESEYFDVVIATEVLEHCYSPEKAVGELHRLLKREGVCVASTRFIHPYHPDPHDYYRFSEDGLKYLFKEFGHVEIVAHGNAFLSAWIVLFTTHPAVYRFVRRLNWLIGRIGMDNPRTMCPSGFVVYAVK
jgi:SAM-dependent methyltransferase